MRPDSFENSVWPMPAIAARPDNPPAVTSVDAGGNGETRSAADVFAELVHRAQLDVDDRLVAVPLAAR